VFRLTPPSDCPAWTRSQRTTTWTRYGVGETHEVPLVSFDAVSVPAGGLQAALFIGMGRSPRCRALRSGQGASGLQRLSRPAGICRAGRFRRHLRERASPEWLWPDAVT